MRVGFARLATCAGAVALLAGLSATSATATARVTPDSGDCRQGEFCLWDDADYQGRFGFFTSQVANLRQNGLNDNVSSVINKTDHSWCLYRDADFSGEYRVIRPGQWVPNLRNSTWGFNDMASSARPC